MSKEKKQNIVQPYRPVGWGEEIEALVKSCIEEGDLEVPDDEREKIEGFVRYCINAGAGGLLKLLRNISAPAEVIKGQVYLVLTPVQVPGRPQHHALGLGYRTPEKYAGPGRVVFIEADQEKFIAPGGK